MALQTSGAISLNQIHVEAGGSSGSQASLNDSDIRGLIGKGSGSQMRFSEWYGAANEVTLTSGGTVNGQNQRKQILASSFVSSGGTLVIPSNMWIWSDSTSVAALTIDVSCTIQNSGKIIGRGGNGGTAQSGGQAGGGGGAAIKINSGVSGVTIQNLSGGYIAGGGGGGAGGNGYGGASSGNTAAAGGGGGAGGGNGGTGSHVNYTSGTTGYGTSGLTIGNCGGGTLNAKGANGTVCGRTLGVPVDDLGFGGQAGGTGGSFNGVGSNPQYAGGGGGGGRILPGVRQNRLNRNLAGRGGYGGAANESGQNAGGNVSYKGGGGGGGWGAAGGNASSVSGGAAGKAINDSGVSYSLSNSGAIYGGT